MDLWDPPRRPKESKFQAPKTSPTRESIQNLPRPQIKKQFNGRKKRKKIHQKSQARPSFGSLIVNLHPSAFLPDCFPEAPGPHTHAICSCRFHPPVESFSSEHYFGFFMILWLCGPGLGLTPLEQHLQAGRSKVPMILQHSMLTAASEIGYLQSCCFFGERGGWENSTPWSPCSPVILTEEVLLQRWSQKGNQYWG